MKKTVLHTIVICLIVQFVSMTSVLSGQQDYKLLDEDTFLEMETVGSPNISPDGKQILFIRSWIDKISDRTQSNFWISDIAGTRVRELTHGNWKDSSPVWSPDGKKIAFLSDRDGTTQILVMWYDTREVAQLTHLEREPSNLKWSPDGEMLTFTSFVPDTDPILDVKLPTFPKGAELAKSAVIVDRLSWARDGQGPTDKGYTHIYILDAELGGTPNQVTSGDYSHNDPQWSADGSKIYFNAIRKPEAEYLRGDSEIYSVDIKSREILTLTDRKGPDRGARISPDGRWIAYTGYDDENYTSTLSSLYFMNSNGGEKRILAGDLPNSPSSVTWAPDGSGVYYLMAEKGQSNLYFVSTKGGIKNITNGIHYLSGLTIAKNGQVASTRSTFHRPAYLITFNLKNPDNITDLVDVNEDVLNNIMLGNVEELWFTSPDGFDLQGWLIKPAEFETGRKYPLLLWIHGGPWSMYSVRWNWAFQNFAADGYAVLYMNPRGSTGYGQDFVNGIQFSYPGKDRDDLLAGVDAAVEKGFIDEDNLFVCGGSGGGVLTAWLVGHTNRFTAAVSMRPVINWHSFVGTTDGSSWYRQFENYPWENPMEYAVRSPLHYVGNITTPTMVMTGEADLRTPMSQSEEYYRALKTLKKETLLVRMPDEYHGWRRSSHRLLQQLYLKAWFEKYRKNRQL